MADVVRCVEDLLAAGKISQDDANRLLAGYGQATSKFLLSGYPTSLTPKVASASAIRSHRAGLAQRRRQRALQLIAQTEAMRTAGSHERGMGSGIAALQHDVERRANGLERIFDAKMGEVMANLRTKTLGLTQDVALAKDVLREAFGQATGKPLAAALARAWAETAELARQLFNRAGGQIAKREDWGMPQMHEPRLIAQVPKQEWIDFTYPLLKHEKMLDANGMPLSQPGLRFLLDQTYDRIVYPDVAPGRSSLGNRHQDHRFLIFHDGDAWLKYHDRFGPREIYATMTGHLEGMANEIALMETFGPSPTATFNALIREAQNRRQITPMGKSWNEALWNVTTGAGNASVMPKLAELSTAARNFFVSTRLGSAVLSAVSDIAFVRQTAAWNGLSSTRFAKELIRQLAELPAGERQRLAVRLGMGAEAWRMRGLAAQRFAEVTGSGWTAKLADLTMRATGLSKWTDAEYKAFGMMFLGELGDHTGKPLGDLPKDLAALMRKRGIDDEGWDQIRATERAKVGGDEYVDIEKIMARADLPEGRGLELARRITEIGYELSHVAVPTPNVETRAVTTGGLPRGTITGEAWRSFAQFKSFPLAVVFQHINRGLRMQGAGNKVRYLGGLIIGTTVAGALSNQLHDIARGRDPREMVGDWEDAKFWGAAFLRGGGAGLYGDFIYGGLSREYNVGQVGLEDFGGPLYGTAIDVMFGLPATALRDVTDERAKFAGELIRFGGQQVPVLSSAWYTRLAFERMLTDQLRLAADPSSARQMSKMQRQRLKEYNQQYWWRPGAAEPQRLPDFEAAVGE